MKRTNASKGTSSPPPPLNGAVPRPHPSTAHPHEDQDNSVISVREVVESGVLRDLSGKTSVVVLLAAIAYRERGEVPNQDQLATVAGVNRKAVGNAVHELEAKQIITVDRVLNPQRLTPAPLPRGDAPEGIDAVRLEASARRVERERRTYRGVRYRSDLERTVAVALDVARVPFGYEVPYRLLFPDLPETDGRTMDFLLAPTLGVEVAGYSDPEYQDRIAKKLEVAKAHGFTLLLITEVGLDELRDLPASVDNAWKSYPLKSGHQLLQALPKAKFRTMDFHEARRRIVAYEDAQAARASNVTPRGVYIHPQARAQLEAREKAMKEADARPVSAGTLHLIEPLEVALKCGRDALALAEC